MFEWIDRIKEEDSGISDTLRIAYRAGKSAYFFPILSTVLGLFIPMVFESNQIFWGIIMVLVLVFSLAAHTVCIRYESRVSDQRKFASETIINQSSMINSLCIEMRDNEHWKDAVFQRVSELVCEKLKNLFKEVYRCDTRVSIEYVFDKEDKKGIPQRFVKMSARRSPNRDSVKKSTPLEKRNMYYSYRIFKENIKNINILDEAEIKRGELWFKNPSHQYDANSDVLMYLGIAVSAHDNEEVDYILQIDFLKIPEFFLKKTNEEIQTFINRYLTSYINIVTLAYLLNLNKLDQIPE